MSGTTAVGNLMNEREHFNMGGADDRVRGTRLGEAAPKGPSEKADGGIRAGSEAVGAMAGNGSAYGQALEPEAEELEEGEICLDEEQRSEEIPGRCAAVLGGGGTQMERGKVSWTVKQITISFT